MSKDSQLKNSSMYASVLFQSCEQLCAADSSPAAAFAGKLWQADGTGIVSSTRGHQGWLLVDREQVQLLVFWQLRSDPSPQPESQP